MPEPQTQLHPESLRSNDTNNSVYCDHIMLKGNRKGAKCEKRCRKNKDVQKCCKHVKNSDFSHFRAPHKKAGQ